MTPATKNELPPAARAAGDVLGAVRDHWDRKAATFDQGDSYVGRNPEVRQEWKRVFTRILGDQPLRILDVGSGTGELVLLFCELGHHAQGIDIAPSMVGTARAKAAARGVATEFTLGDAHRLPFPDGSFDAVHARHLLWTLPQPAEALREWRRVLRPGGKVLVTESARDGATTAAATLRQRIGRALTVAAAWLTRSPRPGPLQPPDYPGRESLPFVAGLGREGLERFLREGGLQEVATLDLLWLRRRQRSYLPWYRRMMSSPLHSYYAAWGSK